MTGAVVAVLALVAVAVTVALQVVVLEPRPASSRATRRRRPPRRRVPRRSAVAPRDRPHIDGVRVVLLRVVPAAVGLLALCVAADWALGAAWDEARGGDPAPGSTELAATPLPPADDPRVDHPALADAPWADRYFAELEALDFTYVPFIGPREATVHGRYVSSSEGIRGSYEPAGARRGDAFEVWFFGGSALWGEGQRDRHTIPSEVARLAEADGTPVRVVNYGLRGYTALQEVLLFEQEVARRGAPDLAVFYHGFNELSTQAAAPENLGAQPTVFQLEVTADAFGRAPALPGQVAPGEPSVRQEYVQTSALHKLWREVQALIAIAPAAADEPFYVPPADEMAEAVDHAEAIYRRTMRLLDHVASAHRVPTAVFWQPTALWLPYEDLTERVATIGGGVDLSEVLDDAPSPVFLDGVHTNELGARLVAEAMWPAVADRLAAGGEP